MIRPDGSRSAGLVAATNPAADENALTCSHEQPPRLTARPCKTETDSVAGCEPMPCMCAGLDLIDENHSRICVGQAGFTVSRNHWLVGAGAIDAGTVTSNKVDRRR